METLARLVTHFRDYHPIEPCRATLDLDAEPPVCAADIQDIKGQGYTQKYPLGPSPSRGRGGIEADPEYPGFHVVRHDALESGLTSTTA